MPYERIHDSVLRNYRANAGSDPEVYSETWQKDCCQNFEEVISNERIWQDCNGNGIASGMGIVWNFTDGSRTVEWEYSDTDRMYRISNRCLEILEENYSNAK